MNLEVKTNIKDPFGWIIDYGEWNLLADYSDDSRYNYLDLIYHRLVDGVCMKELEDKSDEELKEEYGEGFNMLIAEAFEAIAEDIRSGNLVIKTEFEK